MSNLIWDVKNIDDFTRVIKNEYSPTIDSDIIKLNDFNNYVSLYEKEQSLKAIKDKKTNLSMESVNYFINNFGFRGRWNDYELSNEKLRIAFFGCSFTYGVGIDENDIFPQIIGKNINKDIDIINLGFPGGSISKSVRLFRYLVSVYKIDIAIFVFPTHWREEFIETNDNHVSYTNIIPNFEDRSFKKWSLFYNLMDNENMLNNMYKNLTIIELLSKQHNIISLYSSWDRETYSFINEIVSDNTKILPYFKFLESMENITNGFARDGVHPGVKTHYTFASEVIDHLQKKYINLI